MVGREKYFKQSRYILIETEIMNGPNSMYKIKPVIKLAEEIELPKCMYRMKIIQNSYCNARVENVSKVSQSTNVLEQAPLPEVAALESRQEAILEQLAELKKQMSALRAELKLPHPSNATRAATVPTSSNITHIQVPIDIVINANPQWPPYSLLALSKLSCLSLNTHMHSTVVDLPQHTAQFYLSPSDEKARPITIRLIWKNVPDTELIVSPGRRITVRGEVNILRYLSRLGPARFNYELSGDPALASGMDCILDLCYSLVRNKTQKDRQADVRVLNSYLQKTQFLMGDDGITLPDIAAWSALKQIGYTTAKELTVNLNKWFQRCNDMFALVS
ncbi:probable aminoacyl tRNA synthase complex-interacting multifunctional protein 2 isoform X2 [Anabrus simplex]|uniref:probable aminoacyl tRNA synthase complex-interacting multifunctional protein 2 isoform X2 n=1 Tax=Anabrus simplex TaxID=316456 RepID=UPI0035A2B5BF